MTTRFIANKLKPVDNQNNVVYIGSKKKLIKRNDKEKEIKKENFLSLKENKDKIEVNFNMPINIRYPYDGYGRLGAMFSESLSFDRDSKTHIIIGHPRKFDKKRGHKYILFTMFEADRIPKKWIWYCNASDGLIVPTKWVKKIFHESGVSKPIKVVPLGIDNFTPTYPQKKPFIFLHHTSFVKGDQKGWKIALKAFIEEFGEDKNIRLILKGREHRWANDIDNLPKKQNIKYIIKDMKRKKLDKLFNCVNCFVYPSRGEGFGLPPVEMMARGIPTILTNAHSMIDFVDLGIPISITDEMVKSHYEGRVSEFISGKWVTPSIDDLRKKMRKVYENYEFYKNRSLHYIDEVYLRYSSTTMFDNFIKAVDELS